MSDQTEHREPLDLAPIRQRFDRFRQYEDAAGGPLTGAEHVTAIAAAWDVEPLLAEVERLRAAANRVRALADGMAAESPKPGPGGFIAEGIYDALDADRAAAGGRAGNPAVEGQPSPITCGRPGCRESEGGYELVANTEPCPQCREEADRG